MTEWNPTGDEEAAYERGWAHAKAWWQPERDLEIIAMLKDHPEFIPVIDLINRLPVIDADVIDDKPTLEAIRKRNQ